MRTEPPSPDPEVLPPDLPGRAAAGRRCAEDLPGVLRRPRSPGVRHDRPPSRAADRAQHAHPSSAAGGPPHARPPPAPAAPPARSRMVDNAVYSAGRRVATPETAAESREELAAGEERLAWLGLYRPEAHELGELASSTTCPSSPSRTRSRPTSGRSSSGTATRCSSSSRPRGTGTRPRRWSSASCTCSSGTDFVITVRHSESPDLSRVRRRMECDPELLAGGREAVLYAMLDGVVDGYRPWSPGWTTTSTRSRPRCSAVTPASRGASTSCPGGPRVPAGRPAADGHARRAHRRASPSTASTRSCAATCGTSPTTSRRWWSGSRVSGSCCGTS